MVGQINSYRFLAVSSKVTTNKIFRFEAEVKTQLCPVYPNVHCAKEAIHLFFFNCATGVRELIQKVPFKFFHTARATFKAASPMCVFSGMLAVLCQIPGEGDINHLEGTHTPP